MKLAVKVTNRDYHRFLAALSACDYHWASGQSAEKPPAFFKTITDPQNPNADLVFGIRIINPDKKLLGYYPLEVLNENEKNAKLAQAKDVNATIAFLERKHHINLAAYKIDFEKKNPPAERIQKFEQELRALVMEKYHIDIVELVATQDENILYIRNHAPYETKAILCQDMTGLYQDYLSNLMNMEQYAEFIGHRYDWLIHEADKLKQPTEESEQDMDR